MQQSALLCSWSSRHARVSAKFGVTKKSGATEVPSGRVTAMSKLRSMAVHGDDVPGGQQHIPEGSLEVGIHLRTLHDALNPKPLNPKALNPKPLSAMALRRASGSIEAIKLVVAKLWSLFGSLLLYGTYYLGYPKKGP